MVCLIAGRPVMVSEARFGGVVAQPACGDAASRRPDGDGMVMLTGGVVLKAARLRLKHGRR
ncbi:MAG: hypothetical protein IPL47_03270 [Phyllobacteriaceae bacterium]|nr:hypothetical protein [Phyllobacteriaceae bacterium]